MWICCFVTLNYEYNLLKNEMCYILSSVIGLLSRTWRLNFRLLVWLLDCILELCIGFWMWYAFSAVWAIRIQFSGLTIQSMMLWPILQQFLILNWTNSLSRYYSMYVKQLQICITLFLSMLQTRPYNFCYRYLLNVKPMVF